MPSSRRDPDRIEVITNPDDPTFGEFAFTVYDNFHPVSGRDTADMKRALRGWANHNIRFGVVGYTINWKASSKKKGWRDWRHLRLRRYRDLFGNDGELLAMIKKKVETNTDWEISLTKIIIAKE